MIPTFVTLALSDLVLLLTPDQWSPCCNDTILQNDVWTELQESVEPCKIDYFIDFDKFYQCYTSQFPSICNNVTGFNLQFLDGFMGKAALNITSPCDWKNKLGDVPYSPCLSKLTPGSNGFSCPAAILELGECFFNRVFEMCPMYLKNEAECKHLLQIKL